MKLLRNIATIVLISVLASYWILVYSAPFIGQYFTTRSAIIFLAAVVAFVPPVVFLVGWFFRKISK